VLEYQEHGPPDISINSMGMSSSRTPLGLGCHSMMNKSVKGAACARLRRLIEQQHGSLYDAFSVIDRKCIGRVTVPAMRRGLLSICKSGVYDEASDSSHSDIGVACACMPVDWEGKVSLRDFCGVFRKDRSFLSGTRCSRQRTDEREQQTTTLKQRHVEARAQPDPAM
jgi:hypothetical protein